MTPMTTALSLTVQTLALNVALGVLTFWRFCLNFCGVAGSSFCADFLVDPVWIASTLRD